MQGETTIGDLTFLTDGNDYACIWHPSSEDHTSKRAIPLAIIAVKLIEDEKDFKRWQEEMTARWVKSASKALNMSLEEIRTRPVGGRNSN